MVRRRLVSGNWKMNLDHLQAIHLVQDLGLRLSDGDVVGLDVSVHPPFTDLRSVQSVVEERRIPVFL
ncbi:MAG: triose-phosphate isomerase, partial [Actinomycetota bacterium]|nr:triose-phosphate isomerase [Actinomycetota bacterium]